MLLAAFSLSGLLLLVFGAVVSPRFSRSLFFTLAWLVLVLCLGWVVLSWLF